MSRVPEGGWTAAVRPGERPVCPVDHHSPDYPTTARDLHDELRAACPVGWSEAHGGFWVMSDYESIKDALVEPSRFSSAKTQELDGSWSGGSTIPTTQRAPMLPLEMDPPLGVRYRSLIVPWLSRTAVEPLRPVVTAYVDRLLDQMAPAGRFDVVTDVGAPVPAMVVTKLLGLDESLAERIAWPFHAFESVAKNSPEFRRVLAEMGWVRDLLEDTARERRASPGDDAISRLVTAEVEGAPVPMGDCIGILMTLVGGGVDTTTNALAHALDYLDRDRALRQRILDEPRVVPRVVDELLRAFPPVWQLSRRVTEQTVIGDAVLEPGERVMLSVLAANHDPGVFPDPTTVNIDRPPNRHLTFGWGVHRCAGLHVARLELEVMIERIVRRFPDHRIVREEARRYAASGNVDGYISMPAVFTAQASR
ncbi:cytochrome P450 [Actinomadura sp. LD22]|uniref:Cytochrome P450 n=1 Tax=Actinomadura physcomitrii TaxID=2650748 RepID=A0A6I4MPS8_9ACTN|nr:cytochrome P450 [Actinomadura physcomitrii]MWA07000.1 cytochrome P450 [Actinomadura physcomitrii]